MTNINPDDLTVEKNDAANQFEIRVGDAVAFLTFDMRGDYVVFVHTQVPPELEGKGLGGKLASAALTWARDNDVKAVPLCPYVAGYLNRHPEFEDAVFRQG
ncbi:MAG: GNAT family N-acetyltransferase [Dehalococcoidia bacterium]